MRTVPVDPTDPAETDHTEKAEAIFRWVFPLSGGLWKSRHYLVGGFNPFEKYESNWIISPGKGERNKYLKPPTSYDIIIIVGQSK